MVLSPHISIGIFPDILYKMVSFLHILFMARVAETIKLYPDNRESILPKGNFPKNPSIPQLA
jgi:hypothetical protein